MLQQHSCNTSPDEVCLQTAPARQWPCREVSLSYGRRPQNRPLPPLAHRTRTHPWPTHGLSLCDGNTVTHRQLCSQYLIKSLQRRPGIEQVQVLADISRLHYVVTATKPVHRLQICPIVLNQGVPPYHSPKLHPGPCSSVSMRPRTNRHTDIQMRVTNIHFVSSTTHAKCNKALHKDWHLPTSLMNYNWRQSKAQQHL